MRHPSISYEELDPDNQDRSTEYYQGVNDGVRYAMNIISNAYPSHGKEKDSKAQALIDALWEVCERSNERRDIWFCDHMGAKFNPVGELNEEERKASIKAKPDAAEA